MITLAKGFKGKNIGNEHHYSYTNSDWLNLTYDKNAKNLVNLENDVTHGIDSINDSLRKELHEREIRELVSP